MGSPIPGTIAPGINKRLTVPFAGKGRLATGNRRFLIFARIFNQQLRH